MLAVAVNPPRSAWADGTAFSYRRVGAFGTFFKSFSYILRLFFLLAVAVNPPRSAWADGTAFSHRESRGLWHFF